MSKTKPLMKQYSELPAKGKGYLWLKVGTLAFCIALWLLRFWLAAGAVTLIVLFDLYGIWQAWKLDKAGLLPK